MPRYHFNVYDGVNLVDDIGTELPDITFARREAIRYAGALLEGSTKTCDFGPEWRMEVTDATGLLLFRLNISVIGAPAVSGGKSTA